jgi:hypothetical protein
MVFSRNAAKTVKSSQKLENVMTELQALKSDVKQYAEVTARLAAHSLIRSHNKPQGDIAEAIAAEAFGGNVLDQSAKGSDVKLPDGELLQVKSVTDYGKPAGTSPILA